MLARIVFEEEVNNIMQVLTRMRRFSVLQLLCLKNLMLSFARIFQILDKVDNVI